MSLQPQKIEAVPAETVRIAKAAFPKGNLCLKLRDELGPIYEDEQFSELYSKEGQPALAPWRLTLVSILQFVEGLSDRQAANMVRSRLDWKYLLGLELTDSGFDYSVLAEYRGRLLAGEAEKLLLDHLLNLLAAKKLLNSKGKQRTDSTHVLANIRLLNRLELVGETLRAALNALAVAAPQWLVTQIPEEWFDLYGRRIEEYRLPEGAKQREEWAIDAGQAGLSLLTVLHQQSEWEWLRHLPALEILRQVWVQNFWVGEDGQLGWRSLENSPPSAVRLNSPYDAQARYATKRELHWVGYKVHLSETCEQSTPNLITQVHTTVATTIDVKAISGIQTNLANRHLLPATQLVDNGYISAAAMRDSQNLHGVNLCGPLRVDASRQGRQAAGYALSDFKIDWEKRQAQCPAGKVSRKWEDLKLKSGARVNRVRFDKNECLLCEAQEQCTSNKKEGRLLQLYSQAEHQAREQQRRYQATPEFKELSDLRAGIEGTLSQAVRVFELRRTRYRGLAKTHLQHILSAVALNLVRIYAWLSGIPRAKTRVSRLAALKPAI